MRPLALIRRTLAAPGRSNQLETALLNLGINAGAAPRLAVIATASVAKRLAIQAGQTAWLDGRVPPRYARAPCHDDREARM